MKYYISTIADIKKLASYERKLAMAEKNDVYYILYDKEADNIPLSTYNILTGLKCRVEFVKIGDCKDKSVNANIKLAFEVGKICGVKSEVVVLSDNALINALCSDKKVSSSAKGASKKAGAASVEPVTEQKKATTSVKAELKTAVKKVSMRKTGKGIEPEQLTLAGIEPEIEKPNKLGKKVNDTAIAVKETAKETAKKTAENVKKTAGQAKKKSKEVEQKAQDDFEEAYDKLVTFLGKFKTKSFNPENQVLNIVKASKGAMKEGKSFKEMIPLYFSSHKKEMESLCKEEAELFELVKNINDEL